MRISDWSSDVCSSDLQHEPVAAEGDDDLRLVEPRRGVARLEARLRLAGIRRVAGNQREASTGHGGRPLEVPGTAFLSVCPPRSEEHTSELQSLMRTSYAVFCLKKQKKHK